MTNKTDLYILFQLIAVLSCIIGALINISLGSENVQFWWTLLSSSLALAVPFPLFSGSGNSHGLRIFNHLLFFSNSKINGSKPNSSSSFLVRLPERIQLKSDKWICGLSEIIYTNSFENFANGGELVVKYLNDDSKTFMVDSGNFKDPYNLLQNLWNVKPQNRFKRKVETEEERNTRARYEAGQIPNATPEEIEQFENYKKQQEKEKAEKEKAEQEAKEKAEREAKKKAEREAKEKSEREAIQKTEREAKEKAEREAIQKSEREAKEKAERDAREQSEKDAAAAASSGNNVQPSTTSNSSSNPTPTPLPPSNYSPPSAPALPNPSGAPSTSTPGQSTTSTSTPPTTVSSPAVISVQAIKEMLHEWKTWIEHERTLREKEVNTYSNVQNNQVKYIEKLISSLKTGDDQIEKLLVSFENGNKKTERLLLDLIASHKSLSNETRKAISQSRSSSTAGLAEHQYKKYGFSFDYDAVIERIVLKIDKSRISEINLSKSLAYFCGFSSEILSQVFNHATYKIDFFNNSSSMFVYADCIQPGIIADKKAPLLRVVPVSVDINTVQSVTFSPIRYFPVNRDSIDCIKIDICNEIGENIKFHYGSTICTLNFLKIA